MASSKFILGSAQFGLDYGISNIHGKTSIKEVSKILLSANQFGINLIDTAPVYGDAEKVLGNLRESADFQFISKIPKMYQEESIDEYLLRIKNIFSRKFLPKTFSKTWKRGKRHFSLIYQRFFAPHF